MQIGDIVMDKDETQPRSQWRLGRVLVIVTDKDGLVRKVKITLTNCVTKCFYITIIVKIVSITLALH